MGRWFLEVCQQVLRDPSAAEDAFQATFLVLVRKAASIRRQQALAAWLYRVAYRIALAAKAGARRRRAQERHGLTMAQATPAAASASHDWQPILHEEVNRLPAKYRVPVVLCYLQGKSHEEASQELGWPLGTVKGRLARARDMLRTRLVRRGVALTTATLATVMPRDASAGLLSGALVDGTVKAALLGTASAQVSALTKGTVRSLALGKLKIAACILLGLGAVALGAGAIVHPIRPGDRGADASTSKEEGGGKETQVATDADGDPLPQGAIRRLGSARFRHGDLIMAMAYSADGRTLVTAGKEGLIHTWDATTGRPQATVLHAPLAFTPAAAFSPDGEILATDNSVDRPNAAFPPKLIVARLTRDAAVVLHRLEVPPGDLRSVAFSRDGKYVAAGGGPDFILLWDVATGQVIRRLKLAGIEVVALSPDGKLLAAIGTRRAIRLWDVTSGEERPPLLAEEERPPPDQEARGSTSLAFSGDGHVLACGHVTGRISLWDAHTGKAIRKLSLQNNTGADGRIEGVTQVAISFDGKIVATSSDLVLPRGEPPPPGWEGTVRLWDVTSGQVRAVFNVTNSLHAPPLRLAFSPDDRTLAVGGALEEIRLLDVRTGQRIRVTNEPDMRACFAAVSPDGKLVATACGKEAIQLWDPRTGRRIGTIPAHGNCYFVTFSPDGTTLATATVAGTTRLWNLATGKEVAHMSADTDKRFLVEPQGGQFATFSPDQQFLVLSGSHTGVSVRRTTTGQRLWHDSRGPQNGWPPTFSVDGQIIAWGCDSPSGSPIVTLRESATGKEAGWIPCPNTVWEVAFCPDGHTVAVAGWNYIQLWDLPSRHIVRQFEQAPPDSWRLSWRQTGVLASANAGDTIVFSRRLRGDTITLTQGQLTIAQNLTIQGLGANNLTISGNHASRVFEIDSDLTVNIADLTIANGTNPDPFSSGGGIDMFRSTLNLTNVAFVGNVVSGGFIGGGALNNLSGIVNINSCTFVNNQAIVTQGEFSGGGAISDGGFGPTFGTLTISDSTFTDNQVINNGGTSYLIGGAVAVNNFNLGGIAPFSVSNCTFTGNQAMYGGAIFASGPSTISSSIFTGNQAQYGAGIADIDPFDPLTVTGSSFTGNQNGGGIYSIAQLTVDSCTFTGNQATPFGGAINSGSLTVTNSTFTANQATAGASSSPNYAQGGAIDSTGSLTVANSSFTNNQAIGFYSAQGGAIENGGLSSFTNCTFSGNQAIGNGPGAFAYGGALDNGFGGLSMTVTSCTLTGNQAVGAAGADGVTTYGFAEVPLLLSRASVAASLWLFFLGRAL